MLQPSFLVGLAAVIALGVAAYWVAFATRVPAIIALLLLGIAAGSTGLVDPDALFGPVLPKLVGVAVAIILFEGGLTLRFRDLKGTERPVQLLVTLGVLVTWAVGTLAAWRFLDLDFDIAVLLGAVLVVSGPTVIAPLIREMRPTARLASVMRWEGVIIDSVGAMVAVVTFEVIRLRDLSEAFQTSLTSLTGFVLVGSVLGIGAAAAIVVALRRHWVPDHLHNAVSLASVVVVYAIADRLSPESGLLAATVMGVTFANQRSTAVGHIVEFSESLRVLLISSLFVVLSAGVDLSTLAAVGWGTMAVVAALVVVARPLAVAVSTLGSQLDWRERLVLSWTAPRGIVAAAVASVLALELTELGRSSADILLPVVFVVIAATVGLYGLTTPLVARLLGVADPAPNGVLIIGANRVARTVADAIADNGFPVRLATAVRHEERLARMAGLDTRYGPVLSEDAPEHLDLSDIGMILALSENDELNALVTLRYARILGRRHVYQLAPHADAEVTAEAHSDVTARVLFGPQITHELLLERLDDGGELRTTGVTESFGLEDVLNDGEGRRVPLFVISGDGDLVPFTAQTSVSIIETAASIISLSAGEADNSDAAQTPNEP